MATAGKEYGSALYSLGQEVGRETEYLEGLEALQALFEAEPRWYDLLCSPSVTMQERLGLLEEALGQQVDRDLVNFLKLLTERGRLRELPECLKYYREQYDADKGILRVTAVTAVPLKEELRDKLQATLTAKTGRKVILTAKTDPAVLGGVHLEYPGRQLDDTLRNRLENIHKALLAAKA